LSCITKNFPKNPLLSKQKAVKAVFAKKSYGDDLRKDYEDSIKGLILKAQKGELEKTEFISEVGILTDAFVLAAYSAGSSSFVEPRAIELEMSESKTFAMEAASDLWSKSAEGRFEDELDIDSKIAVWGSVIGFYFSEGLTKNAANPWLRWNVGPTDHCSDCLGNEGVIKRAADWELVPQDRNLECQGFKCQCYFTIEPELEQEFLTL
jgi:hypothetical protein